MEQTTNPQHNSGGYGKRPIWQWILLYVVIGGIIYAVVYFVFFANKSGYSNNQPTYQTQQQSPRATASPQTAGNEQTVPAQATITYGDNGFSPSTLTVPAGTTVIFKNTASDSFWPASGIHPTHTLYDGTTLQEHCAHPTATTFDACKPIPSGQSWSFKFTKIGSWQYHNHLDPGETGIVVVQ